MIRLCVLAKYFTWLLVLYALFALLVPGWLACALSAWLTAEVLMLPRHWRDRAALHTVELYRGQP